MENYKAKFEKLIQRINELIVNGLIHEKVGKSILKDFTVESEDENMRKPADKVEPKFKAGNWYLCAKDFYGKGVRFDKGRAYYCKLDGCLQEFDTGAHIDIDESLYDYFNLWTIQDAKDGDVLHKVGFSSDCIFIFNSIEDGKATAYCCIDVSADKIEFGIQGPDNIELNNITPATTVQRDLLFQKMHEAGYEWDDNKKELKKIESNSAWSEEDRIHITNCIQLIGKTGVREVEWLKSLESRILPQPKQKWSKEDERKITGISMVLESWDNYHVSSAGLPSLIPEYISWLNALKDRIGCETER